MLKYCYLNGKIVETENATISVADIGVLRGYGVFDFLRTFGRKPFLMDEHLTRFENSAKLLGLKIPISRAKIKKVITDLIEKNDQDDVGIRLVLTGGSSDDGLNFDENKPTFAILVQKIIAPNVELYQKGAKIISFEYQREVPRAKTINYITKLALKPLVEEQKAFDILYKFDGSVFECSISNFYVFKNDTLITPKDNILLGTRRAIVLNLARDDFKVEERVLSWDEVLGATEAFITSINRDILPVTQIDDQKIGDGKVGANTKKLMKKYDEFIENMTNG